MGSGRDMATVAGSATVVELKGKKATGQRAGVSYVEGDGDTWGWQMQRT